MYYIYVLDYAGGEVYEISVRGEFSDESVQKALKSQGFRESDISYMISDLRRELIPLSCIGKIEEIEEIKEKEELTD